MRDTIKALVPASLKRRLREYCWQKVSLDWQLHSGIKVELRSRSDWVMYNDIFVNGDYDEIIDQVIRQRPVDEKLRIFDLGANIGLFTLRCFDRLFSLQRNDLDISIAAFEASPGVYRHLARHVSLNQLGSQVQVFCGLIGQRSGHATFYESEFSAENTTAAQLGTPSTIPYLDLQQVIDDGSSIDLLKVDIEGSELDFLTSYPELLSRSKIVALELHHQRCDTQKCVDLLNDYRFKEYRSIRETDFFSMRLYQRGS